MTRPRYDAERDGIDGTLKFQDISPTITHGAIREALEGSVTAALEESRAYCDRYLAATSDERRARLAQLHTEAILMISDMHLHGLLVALQDASSDAVVETVCACQEVTEHADAWYQLQRLGSVHADHPILLSQNNLFAADPTEVLRAKVGQLVTVLRGHGVKVRMNRAPHAKRRAS